MKLLRPPRVLAPLAFLLALAASPAMGQERLLDNFAYPAGQPLTAHGWTEIRNGTPVLVTTGSLSRAGYPHSGIGNSARLVDGNLQEVMRRFEVQTSGSVYLSFLLNLTSVTDVSNSGLTLYLGPRNSDIFDRVAALWINQDGSGNVRFGVEKTSGILSTGYNYSLETTYLVVLEYEFVPEGSKNDRVKLWINPDLSQPKPAPLITQINGDDVTEIAEIILSQVPPSSTATIDGIRIGTVWQPGNTIFADGFEIGDFDAWSDVECDCPF